MSASIWHWAAIISTDGDCKLSLTMFIASSTDVSSSRDKINLKLPAETNKPAAVPLTVPSIVVALTCSMVAIAALKTLSVNRRRKAEAQQFQWVGVAQAFQV